MRSLKLVNGVPRMVDDGDAVVVMSPDGSRHLVTAENDGTLVTTVDEVYNQIFTAVGNINPGTPITLPASGDYLGEELEITHSVDGLLDFGVDYFYVGTGIKTQVILSFKMLNAETLTFKKVV